MEAFNAAKFKMFIDSMDHIKVVVKTLFSDLALFYVGLMYKSYYQTQLYIELATILFAFIIYFIYCHLYSAFSIVQCSKALYRL